MEGTVFGLRQRPFPATPDSASYYPATRHEFALHRLNRGLADGEGILLLTGEPGTGKTLLCHCLVERLSSEKRTAFLTNSHLNGRVGLLQAILFDLGLPYEGRSEQEMRLALTEHLLASYVEGRSTILLIDEAQHLTPDLLEELRMLGNLEAAAGKALQIILVGQPSLLDTLRLPELASLRQRLAVRTQLDPLDPTESVDYLQHHLRIAGASPDSTVFSEEALQLLARACGGVPRVLNQAAYLALRFAEEAEMPEVEAEAVLETLETLGLQVPDEESFDEDFLPMGQQDTYESHGPKGLSA